MDKRGLSPFFSLIFSLSRLKSWAVPILLFGFLGIVGNAFAAQTISSVTLDGGASVTVLPGATISAVVTVTTNGGTAWSSTRFTTNPATTTSCINHVNYTVNGTYSETFNITAPPVAGTYNAIFRASNIDTCGGGGATTTTLTLTGGIVVATAPTAATVASTLVNATGATLNGLVSSNGASTAVTFDYGLTVSYGSSATASVSPLAANVTNSAVSAVVTGLTCNTTYHFRVKGVNSVGTTNGSDLAFTTTACMPTATTNPATGLSVPGGAMFNGTVSSNGASTDVTFDYGLTTSYGSTVTATGSPLAAGASNTPVSRAVTGLTCGATYHFRARAANVAGTVNGNDLTFATPACAVFLGKSVSTASAAVGSYVTFNLTATNSNAADLSNVILTDAIPADLVYSANVLTLGSASVTGQTLTWTIPSLPSGASAQLTLVIQLTKKGSYTNTVTSPGAASASASILVLPSAITHYRLDEPVGTWVGTTGEVDDSGGNGLNGRRRTTTAPTVTNTQLPTPTIASQYSSVVGDFCNAGNFDGRAVVESASSTFFQFTNKLSASAWIYPTAYPSGGSDLYSILSNDTNYEFHLNPTGRLYWWWNASSMTSAAIIPLNQWTHIAITLDSSLGASSRQRIYINGVPDTNTNNWSGTLQTNACPFYIGGDITTGAGCALLPARNFRGKIDEAKIYDYELSAGEVQADMTLGRLCGASAFDHIRIEHDGTASVCAPKTVTVKACLNASCTTLYPGTVTASLTPTGWLPSNTVTVNGGVTTATLSNASISAPSLTLGGNVTGSATAANPTVRCFKGATETCSLSVVAASCTFDAVETGANPQTRIFTKLAGTAFSLDVLALSTSTTINPSYSGTVAVDLVDASTSACPTGAGLNTATNVTFASTGRKPVTFNYPNAARNVRVRAKVGASSPACSSDNFAIRPAQFAVTSDMSNVALTGTPKAVAGSAFTLTAAAGVASGFDGTPTLNVANVNDHNGLAIAGGTLSGNFGAGTGPGASGAGFRYLDVGNIQLATDAVVDNGFTAVDQTTDCDAGSTSYTPSAGKKFGCSIGSAPSAKLGRWYPSHYSFVGTLTPVCGAGNFTYMGQDALSALLTVRAHASTGLPATVLDPMVNRYTYAAVNGYPNLAPVTFAGDNGGAAVALGRLGSPAFPAMPNSTLWTAGQLQINGTYAFSKLPAPDGPYELFKLMASLNDPDGSLLIGTSAQKETNATRIRYGRVSLSNAYGSELLNLPLDLRVQYWAGTAQGWLINAADTCTVIKGSDFAFSAAVAGNNLAPCETAITLDDTAKPNYTATLTRPGAGNAGWTDISLNLGAATGNRCTATGAVGAAATTADALWLQFNWTGVVDNPRAHATFGVYRSGPIIHRREMY